MLQAHDPENVVYYRGIRPSRPTNMPVRFFEPSWIFGRITIERISPEWRLDKARRSIFRGAIVPPDYFVDDIQFIFFGQFPAR